MLANKKKALRILEDIVEGVDPLISYIILRNVILYTSTGDEISVPYSRLDYHKKRDTVLFVQMVVLPSDMTVVPDNVAKSIEKISIGGVVSVFATPAVTRGGGGGKIEFEIGSLIVPIIVRQEAITLSVQLYSPSQKEVVAVVPPSRRWSCWC